MEKNMENETGIIQGIIGVSSIVPIINPITIHTHAYITPFKELRLWLTWENGTENGSWARVCGLEWTRT